ncbi:hypothetical protein [Rhizobium ruizarguesonis]|uniref:hypothetical protein n=1 Tax=Rhizobium ruizarguesonis TaxID=2081791 RepID=UPI0013EE8C94|nr:hypothetical protein [Rhizobium ruizarguesonis]
MLDLLYRGPKCALLVAASAVRWVRERAFLVVEEADMEAHLFGGIGYDRQSIGAGFTTLYDELVTIRLQSP